MLRWTWLLAVLLALILVPFFLFEAPIEAWAARYFHGEGNRTVASIALAALLAGDIVLPVPSSLVSTALGYLAGAAGGTLFSWAGMTAACLIGYGLGRAAARTPARRWVGEEELRRVHSIFDRHGAWGLVLCRPVPVLAEASVFFAGFASMRFGRFLWMTALPNLGVSFVYAVSGAISGKFGNLFTAFAAALVLSAIPWLAAKLFRR